MSISYIGLGANLGATHKTLNMAINDIKNIPNTRLMASSSFYSSAPIDSHGPEYTNAVIKISTNSSAEVLLTQLQKIEDKHGRVRPYKNAPRTLDLDILLFDKEFISTDRLIIPHPRMHMRAFVLVPLFELEPDIILPQGSKKQLLEQIKDQDIRKLSVKP